MKKTVTAILMTVLIVLSLTACSSSNDDTAASSTDSAETTSAAEETTVVPGEIKEPVTYGDSKKDLSEASITESEAVDLVKAFSAEELGLEGSKDDYKFMVATVGKNVNDGDYFEVIASVVKAENEDGSINMETVGTYYVSYDGKQIFLCDTATGELTELTK
ncbi:MAG: hypothetical protein PUE08_07880 [Eubacteriales bacterium]|nr:hypothetical protein [Eubacteriales bacterium]